MALFRKAASPRKSDRGASARVGGGAAGLVGVDGDLEPAIRAIGEELLERARGAKSGVLSKQFWSDKLMDWSMKDQQFKVQLFRFVDAFPVLRHSSDAVHEHLVDYLTQPGVKLPAGMELGLSAGGLAKGLMTKTVSGQIEGMARKFIAGTDAADALGSLKKLWESDIAFSVDLLGEACVSDAEADGYLAKYLDLVNNLPETVGSWNAKVELESDHLGAIPRTNVSIKISSLSARSNPIDTDGAIRDLKKRVLPILEAAKARGVFINFDMEQYALKDLTLRLFMECAEAVATPVGLAMQAYLKSGDSDARRIVEWAKRTGRVVTVRLVKGAYWDYETIHAEQMGWKSPVWNTKRETDACFERMSRTFVDSTPREAGQGGVKLALGSHNARSIGAVLAMVDATGLPRNAIELQMLHGMADQLKSAGTAMGLRVREYVPVGEMIPGMAYLVRRLLENTSNESWLKAGFLDNADAGELLRSPHGASGTNGAVTKRDLVEIAPERHALSVALEGVGDGKPFFNESLRDFAYAEVRGAFAEKIRSAAVPQVRNDSTVEQAHAAVKTAHEAFAAWRDLDPRKRARVLTGAAEAMRARRDELSGIIIKENGKGWVDADADVCEAIDFCEYYARESVGLFRRERMGRFIGELDEQWYQARGVAAVISPWNFPLAIACGMVTAALVTGNTVVLKPAEQTPGIAKVLAEILWEALASEDVLGSRESAHRVLHFLPGQGETVGAALVRDPRVAIIAFTGSKAVGLDIIQASGVTPEEQHFVKKVVCEMGGKNAIVVDTSADLDEAVLGVRQSAFGFQGQKCSACSRCIVVDPDGPDGHHTRLFIERLVESTRSLVIGDPLRSGTDVGPVIDAQAGATIRRFIEKGKAEGCRVELEMELPGDDAFVSEHQERFVGPVIFSGVTMEHSVGRDEIFGPVLSIMHARSYDEAIALANASVYKLTGGVFSRKPSNLERAKREFRVGNLYLNRGITGALVGRQPFGGFGMSGVGSKAGGRDYLLQFVEPRASCENTMRRGFAPEL